MSHQLLMNTFYDENYYFMANGLNDAAIFRGTDVFSLRGSK